MLSQDILLQIEGTYKGSKTDGKVTLSCILFIQAFDRMHTRLGNRILQ